MEKKQRATSVKKHKKPAPRSRIRKIAFEGPQGNPLSTVRIDGLIERFLGFIRHERGLAENTQSAYQRDLQSFGT